MFNAPNQHQPKTSDKAQKWGCIISILVIIMGGLLIALLESASPTSEPTLDKLPVTAILDCKQMIEDRMVYTHSWDIGAFEFLHDRQTNLRNEITFTGAKLYILGVRHQYGCTWDKATKETRVDYIQTY